MMRGFITRTPSLLRASSQQSSLSTPLSTPLSSLFTPTSSSLLNAGSRSGLLGGLSGVRWASSLDMTRNIAIIAHVDHGKTSLVDKLLQSSDQGKSDETDRLMDHNDLERERGITIMAKYTSLTYTRKSGETAKINILDTPGHGDFGGEVERILSMVDGVCLVVDASHGPGVQTKFVLSKALQKGLKPLVVLNKMDRPSRQVAATEGKIFDLFCSLGADDDQMEYETMYASAKEDWANTAPERGQERMAPLLEAVIDHIPPPSGDAEKDFGMLVSLQEADDHLGRIAVGTVESGTLKVGDPIAAINRDGEITERGTVTKLLVRRGLGRVVVDEATTGDIVGVAGLAKASVTDTVRAIPEGKEKDKSLKADWAVPIPSDPLDPPVLSMSVRVNDSPLAGQEGTKCTSKAIEDRLEKEIETNVSLRVEKVSDGAFEVFGRGELQLAILLENMRREGFELSVTQPMVIMRRDEHGDVVEPIEDVTIQVPDEYSGAVIEQMNKRLATLIEIIQPEEGDSETPCVLKFECPSRGLIGFRSALTHLSRGTATLDYLYLEHRHFLGPLTGIEHGSLISMHDGKATAYAIAGLESRGTIFIKPQTQVYSGMVVGEHFKPDQDLDVNIVKAKQLTNVRAAGKDDAVRLATPRVVTLENALSYVQNDEMIEITPQNIRLRKRELQMGLRRRDKKQGKAYYKIEGEEGTVDIE